MFGGQKRWMLVVHYSTGPFSASSVEKQKSVFACGEITRGNNCFN